MATNKFDDNKDANAGCGCKSDNRISLGDFIRVVDNKEQKVIVQGQVHFEKVRVPPIPNLEDSTELIELTGDRKLVSIDNEYFFKLDDDAYTVEKLDVNFLDEDYVKQNYRVEKWSEYRDVTRDCFNLYRENTINELDEGVENIVGALNEFSPSLVTTGSCSGHKLKPAWVSFRIEDARTLNDFLNFFEPYKDRLDVTTEEKLYTHRASFRGVPFFPRHMEMTLRTTEIGEDAWRTLDEFAAYLRKVIDLRNKSNALLEDMMTQEKMYLRAKRKQMQD